MATMHQRRLASYKNDGLGLTVIALDAIFLGLSALALCLRIASRHIQGHGLCLNDYAAIMAWVSHTHPLNRMI